FCENRHDDSFVRCCNKYYFGSYLYFCFSNGSQRRSACNCNITVCICLMDIPIFNRAKNDIEIKKRKTEIKNKTCEKNICFRDGWIYDGIDKFCCYNCL